MRAAQVKAFGGPEVLTTVELPDPVPGPGEILIEVAHTDTLHVETQIRAGRARAWFEVEPPYVPGGGVSGTVTAVGDGVDAEWAGRRPRRTSPGGPPTRRPPRRRPRSRSRTRR
ncbi:hypothetical protein JHN52_39940, partial [Streptomyces sp. MBT97]|uniref:alcohol dehydrogenase catalytic domain-containing protein n=1 Tax=Streptomyces sp. MBT97 TaxID=2800411 RepID=UPI001A3216CA|nr:hypothetical protein [Streptomyces sp. MBT97]